MVTIDAGEGFLGGVQLRWAALTDVGNVRSLNEDSLLAEPPVFVVADGMGGHDSGEVASGLTVQRLETLVDGEPTTAEEISQELHHINALLRSASSGDESSVMGTTGVGLAVVDNGGVTSWLVFNVGDSRAYAYTEGALIQISRDHSFVQELVDAGELSAEEARTHPNRNVVTRALGADPEVKPDYWVRPIRPGERYLLCSDGLSGEVDDATLASILASGLPPDEAAATLVGLALEAGGRDNVTAVIVDVLSVPAFDDASTDRNSQKLRALRELAFDGHDTSPRGRSRTPATGGSADEPATSAGDGLIAAVPSSPPAAGGTTVEPEVHVPILSVPEGLEAQGGEAMEHDEGGVVEAPLIDMPSALSVPEELPAPPPPLTADEQVDLDALRRFKEERDGGR